MPEIVSSRGRNYHCIGDHLRRMAGKYGNPFARAPYLYAKFMLGYWEAGAV